MNLIKEGGLRQKKCCEVKKLLTRHPFHPADFKVIDDSHHTFKVVFLGDVPSILRINNDNCYLRYDGDIVPLATRSTVERAKRCLHELTTKAEPISAREYYLRGKAKKCGISYNK
jgi:hypothetical protein